MMMFLKVEGRRLGEGLRGFAFFELGFVFVDKLV